MVHWVKQAERDENIINTPKPPVDLLSVAVQTLSMMHWWCTQNQRTIRMPQRGLLLEMHSLEYPRQKLWHAIEPQTICHLIVKDKVAEQHILGKYSNCNSFGVTMDLTVTISK